MQTALSQGYPIIAFVDATQLGRGYIGHWFVVTGISADGKRCTSMIQIATMREAQEAKVVVQNIIR